MDPLDGAEVTGDAAMDAFGAALEDAAWTTEHALGRLPEVRELAGAFEEALIAAGYAEGEVREKLAPFRATTVPRVRT